MDFCSIRLARCSHLLSRTKAPRHVGGQKESAPFACIREECRHPTPRVSISSYRAPTFRFWPFGKLNPVSGRLGTASLGRGAGCTIGSLRSSRRVMDREEFLHQVNWLRGEGESIRSIAKALGVHRSRVERALKALARGAAKRDGLLRASSRAGGFVGRHHELGRVNAALEDV